MTSNPRRQRVCILGSTGSIGTSTLDVIALHPDTFEVFALTGQRRVDELFAQILRWRPRYAALPDAAAADELGARVKAAGLATEVLANKEALVVGGQLFVDAVKQGGATLIPIDSEHSAIFQCLPTNPADWDAAVDHIVLTASGGPFRTRDPATLESVTPDQACAHPNWVMGRKISVDSATMMNKALEVIEARWLFDLAPERIKVVIHPQSIIHSMVVARDGAVLAQLGTPDMKGPISFGMSWPSRMTSGCDALDFTKMAALTFEEADARRFPGLHLSWAALRAAPGSTTVLNAANEIAVEAFLAGRLSFPGIHRVNAQALEQVLPAAGDAQSLEALLALDARARDAARAQVAKSPKEA